MAKSKPKSAATLTVRSINDMTTKGRKDIVDWLRRQASFIAKYGSRPNSFAKVFTARYLY